MGYMRHHAIIVTGGDYGDHIAKAHSVAEEIFIKPCFPNAEVAFVSPILPKSVNGYRSFLVAPDGSKEGWGQSEAGDACRDEFVKWLNDYRYSDGSSPLSWVEVQYGDDNGETKIIRHSDEVEIGDEYAGAANAEEACS